MAKINSKYMIWLILLPCALAVAEDTDLETRVKAAFLFKFCNYIEWPASAFADPDAPLIIAVAEADALARELEQAVADRRIQNRPLVVRKVKAGDQLDGVHMLFVGGKKVTQGHSLIALPAKPLVLTVTEAENDSLQSMINFVVEDNRVRFDISQQRAERAGLKLSSLLLSVARKVERKAAL